MVGVFSGLLVLSAAATNDILSWMLGIPIELITWIARIAVIVIPLVSSLWIARYSRRRLNRKNRDVPSTETEAQKRYIAA